MNLFNFVILCNRRKQSKQNKLNMKNFFTNLKNILGSNTKQQDKEAPKRKIELREGTAEFELFIAKSELESGKNLAHGASHLANLIHYDPTCTEWLEMARQYMQAAGDNPEETLLPKEEKRYVATEALRAWIWHAEGKLQQAIELLIHINKSSSNSSYLINWGIDWIYPEGKLESLSEDMVLQLYATILNLFGEANLADYKSLQLVRKWTEQLQRIPYESPHWTMIRIGLLRKSGYLNEALQVAGPLDEAQNWHHAIAIGLILRRKEDPQQAEKAFIKALEYNPEDISARLEAADTWYEFRYWQQALQWYEDVLKKEPEHVWALPSSLYCQWRLSGDETKFEAVIKMATDGNDRAYQLWIDAYSALPEPCDATANILRQITDKYETKAEEQLSNSSFELKVSALEAPSNALAFRLEMERLKCDTVLHTTVEKIPIPDPREPSEPVRWLLWKYDGTDATPALPPPSPDVVEAIQELARKPYNTTVNWAAASHTAVSLGAKRCAEILAVATYPPPAPADSYALEWLPRVQLCVAQVLSYIDRGWDDSVRRDALLSMLFGPSDWTVTAAIRAMTWIARTEPMYQLPIHTCFKQLEKAIPPKDSYCCWASTLYKQWLLFPFLFDSERKELEQKKNQYDDDAT